MEFLLRPFQHSDAVSLALYANNSNIAKGLLDIFPHPYTLEHARDFIAHASEKDEKTGLDLALVVDGAAVGSLGLRVGEDVYRKDGRIGYWIGEPFWGKGVMTRAVAQFCARIFAGYDLVRLTAEAYDYNVGSRKVAEKNGFVLEGVLRSAAYKLGGLHSLYLYGLLREDWEKAAHE